jgi:transcriptional regulator with XRE-family HTH domain
MASIGQELKRERELRGISLNEIADSTKINIRFLRALEENQLDILPEQFFTKGIIRNYAKYLGLDEQSVINTYLESLGAQTKQEKLAGENEDELRKTLATPPKEKRISLLFALMVLVILSLIIIMYFLFREGESLPQNLSKIQSTPQKAQEKPMPNLPVIQEEPEVEPEELNLEILVQQETWIEIFADQEKLDTGLKYPGDRLQFKANKEFLIHIGNAGGITYTINGKAGIKFGEPGTVKRDILITSDNYKDFLDEKEKNLDL